MRKVIKAITDLLTRCRAKGADVRLGTVDTDHLKKVYSIAGVVFPGSNETEHMIIKGRPCGCNHPFLSNKVKELLEKYYKEGKNKIIVHDPGGDFTEKFYKGGEKS